MNNEIIAINYVDERPTVSGRELHAALEVKTPYTQWFDRMTEYGFSENEDYILVSQKSETNNPKNPYTTITDHNLTIPMAKELCMLQRNEKGKQFRQYFIKVEEAWNSPEMVMKRAMDIANARIEELKSRTLTLESKVEEDKPKVLFANAVEAAQTSILIGDLAKILKQNGVNTGQKRLFEWLRNEGFLIKGGSSKNMPTQKAMEMELFEVKETTINNPDGSIRITKTPKVTGKGQTYFVNKFLT